MMATRVKNEEATTGIKMEQESLLRVHIEVSNPIELTAFAASLRGYGDNFNQFSKSKGYKEASLLVKEVNKGSIIVDLVCDYIPLIAEYFSYFKYIFTYFCDGKKNEDTPEVLSREARQVENMVLPVTDDPYGKITISHVEGDVTINSYSIGYQQANACTNAAEKIINTEVSGKEDSRSKMLLTIERASKGMQKTGNMGVIEDIFPKPLSLVFNDDECKDRILHNDPFNNFFIVDVVVQSAKGHPQAYKILKVYDVIPLVEE